MEFIIHKINTIKGLNQIPKEYGCEIDIRTDGSRLILNHDPFTSGDFLTDYLDEYDNATLVLNIKESGIEDYVLEEVKKRGIKSYFLSTCKQSKIFLFKKYLFYCSVKSKCVLVKASKASPKFSNNTCHTQSNYIFFKVHTSKAC